MKALFIIDPQQDFINGTLIVPNGEKCITSLSNDIDKLNFNKIIVTLDWHPSHHSSFQEWPVHCVQHSVGAAIFPPLREKLYKQEKNIIISFLTKGNFEKEEYSIFQNSLSRKEAIETLYMYDEIYVCGLAGDVCVLNTLTDMLSYISPNKIKILSKYTASLDDGNKLFNFAKNNKITII